MEEYIQDIMKQKKLYAHINFFKLLKVGELSEKDNDSFYLIDGTEKVHQLMNDIKERNIELFYEDGEAKYISALYDEMGNLCHELQSMKVSKSPMLENAFEEVTRITSYYNCRFLEDDMVADLTLLTFLPIDVIMGNEVKQTIVTPLPKQKKLGER